MGSNRWLGLCFVLLSATACGESAGDGNDNGSNGTRLGHVARTSGSAIALSRDERIAVATNRNAGVVTVFTLNPSLGAEQLVTSTTELDTGEGSEPWTAVIGADDDTAYVILRKSHELVRITSLRKNPTIDNEARIPLDAEPTAVAITPSGKKLIVANWGEGSLSVVTTEPFALVASLDLNSSLVDTGVLGELEPRSGLAHPRALAITDNGDNDDLDETLYATEFFSQPLLGVLPEADGSHVDRNRQGFVYAISLKTGNLLQTIPLSPAAETGFVDSNGRMTSCFPNQLSAAAVAGARLYVTAMCTSPSGPLGKPMAAPTNTDNFKTLLHPTVFVIDTLTNQELSAERRLLTQVLRDSYAADGSEVGVRMPLLPNDLAFAAPKAGGSRSAYVAALGADAVFRLDYDASALLTGIGSPGARFIDVKASLALPIGVAASRTSKRSFVLALNDTAQILSAVDATTEAVATFPAVSATERAAESTPESYGKAHFVTGLDVWSYKGQAWSSCESCHPGGLSDGVTWFFARGPRRTLSPANTYDKTHAPAERNRRLMLWGANIDEVHDIEAIVREVSGGVGGVVWRYAPGGQSTESCRLMYNGNGVAEAKADICGSQKHTTLRHNGLNGSLSSITTGALCGQERALCDTANSKEWNEIDAFMRSMRAPTAPTRLNAEAVSAGRAAFVAGRCAGCHGGPGWTVSTMFYEPGLEENGALPYDKPDTAPPLGRLRETIYTVPGPLISLNPAAQSSADCAAGERCATYRVVNATGSAEGATAAVYQENPTNDQLRCALRDVGTFPMQGDATEPANVVGRVPPSAPTLLEYRQDMTTLAQGRDGMNVPSLFGLSVGAPFLHGGNARTLEELLSDTFADHHRALAKDFLGDPETRDSRMLHLVAYLLSIDETTPTDRILDTGPDGSPLKHDFCQR